MTGFHRLAAYVLSAALAVAGAAFAQPRGNFVASLSGDEEVPPVDTNGRGLAKLQLDPSGSELSYHLMAAGLEGVTQAHIHCGPAGVNGDVVVFLFGFDPAGVDVNGVLADGVITSADVIPRPDSPECPGGVADLDDVIEQIRAGNAYVNIHTTAHPGGEVRGQLQAGGPPPPEN